MCSMLHFSFSRKLRFSIIANVVDIGVHIYHQHRSDEYATKPSSCQNFNVDENDLSSLFFFCPNQTSFRSVYRHIFQPVNERTARSLSHCNEVETKRCPRRDASRANFTRVGSLCFVSMRQTSARKSRRE